MNTPEKIMALHDSHNETVAVVLTLGDCLMVIDRWIWQEIDRLMNKPNVATEIFETFWPEEEAEEKVNNIVLSKRFKHSLISSGEAWTATEDWALVSAVRQAQAENLFGRPQRKQLWIDLSRTVLKERSKDAIASRYRKLYIEGKFDRIAASLPPK